MTWTNSRTSVMSFELVCPLFNFQNRPNSDKPLLQRLMFSVEKKGCSLADLTCSLTKELHTSGLYWFGPKHLSANWILSGLASPSCFGPTLSVLLVQGGRVELSAERVYWC